MLEGKVKLNPQYINLFVIEIWLKGQSKHVLYDMMFSLSNIISKTILFEINPIFNIKHTYKKAMPVNIIEGIINWHCKYNIMTQLKCLLGPNTYSL